MNETIIYKEKILSTGLILILGLVTLAVASFFFIQILFGPIGSKPAPDIVYAFLTIFFCLITWNFAFLNIEITNEKIKVNYGIIQKSIPWSKIEVCEKDVSDFFYGYGVRFGIYKKHWVWVYNIMGSDRVAFLTQNNSPKGLIVSTKNPDELTRIANTLITK